MTKSIARGFRTDFWATLFLQRVYRGHMKRKRVLILRRRYLDACVQFRALTVRCIILVHARRRKVVIVRLQSHIRRFGCRLNYLLFRIAIIKLQRKFRIWRWKETTSKARALEEKNRRKVFKEAALVIEYNYRATKFNKSMAPFMLLCAAYVSAADAEVHWKVNNVQVSFFFISFCDPGTFNVC